MALSQEAAYLGHSPNKIAAFDAGLY